MILMYHKIYPFTLTHWWVSADAFYRQLAELRSYTVVSLDEYDPNNKKHAVITFDDAYQNVLIYAAPLLYRFKYPFEVFINGDTIGKTNSFDRGSGEPVTKICSEAELKKLVELGGRLQWHGSSHTRCTDVKTKSKLKNLLTVPAKIRNLDPHGFNWFSYPHGEFNTEVKSEVEKLFIGAVSCNQGNNEDRFCLNRETVTSKSSFKSKTVGVIITSYNKGQFLVEAVDSVLRQTILPDQILLMDDCSTDETQKISEIYEKNYPNLIVYHRNKKNLGIIETFNNAVSKINTDYVCFLDADNRFRSDYIERTEGVLNSNPHTAIAYTDFALFGSRSASKYDLFPPEWRRGIKDGKYYIVGFPNFSETTKRDLETRNFIHGNSLFRRDAFYEVGGYKKLDDRPEDHDLFWRMIDAGWAAKRVPLALLKYRQYSKTQENDRFNSFAELNFYRKACEQKQQQLLLLEQELQQIKSSKVWFIIDTYKNLRRSGKHMPKKIVSKLKKELYTFLLKTPVLNSVFTTVRRQKKLSTLTYPKNAKLNLGCGKNVIDGWINADIDDSINPNIIFVDLRKPLPFKSDSAKQIFIEHTVECLSKIEGINLYKECIRVLKPGGCFRIGISDMSRLMKAYQTKDKYYEKGMRTDMQPTITQEYDEFTSDMLFNWDRKYYYTARLMKRFLEDVGFEKVKIKKYMDSDYGFSYDTRTLPDTSYLEARKPV